MISGPTIPRTPDGVRNLVHDKLELVEPGLLSLCEDLELPSGVAIDAVARDAAGCAVLVFTVVNEDAAFLASRVREAHGWFRHHGDVVLADMVEAAEIGKDGPRALVVGVELSADALVALQDAGLAALEVHQFCAYRYGGELRLRCRRLLPEAENDATHQAGTDWAADPPPGLHGKTARELCGAFMDRVRRLDPRIRARGDRFGRVFRLLGWNLGELRFHNGRLWFRAMPGEAADPVDMAEDLGPLVDGMARRLLAFEGLRQAPVDDMENAESAALDGDALGRGVLRGDAPAAAGTATSLGGLDEARFSLEPIRSSILDSQVSAEEVIAFEEDTG